MKALLFEKERTYHEHFPDPAPPAGEVLIRVSYAGICATDLEIMQGYMGFSGIAGHEFVGLVAGPDDSPWCGKRVVGEINCGCDACTRCRSGDQRHCSQRTVLGIEGRNGAFAEYLLLPEDRLHEVPPGLTDEEAVFTEPCAAACRILEQVAPLPDRVLVIGDGKLGLLAAQVLGGSCEVHLLGHHSGRAKQVCGEGVTILEALPENERFSMVVEASGSSSGLTDACRAVEPEGVLVLKSTYHGAASVDLSLSVVVPEVMVLGSRCGPFDAALEMLSTGAVETETMIDGIYALDQWREAFRVASEPGALKVLFRIS